MKNWIVLLLALFISQTILAAPVIVCQADGSIDQIVKISVSNSDIAGVVAAQVTYLKESHTISLILTESEGNMDDDKILVSKVDHLKTGTAAVFIEKTTLGWHLVKYHSMPTGESVIELDRTLKCQLTDDEAN